MMYHNIVKIGGAHRIMPAQAASIDSQLWEVGDIVKVVEDSEAVEAQARFDREDTDGESSWHIQKAYCVFLVLCF